MIALQPHIVPNQRLDFAARHGPEHLRPIYRAVRHGEVDHVILMPNAGAFRPGRGRPLIVLVGDDLPSAQGVRSFHRKTLRRLIGQSGNVSLMIGAPVTEGYAQAAKSAVVSGKTVTIIETTAERAEEWAAFVRLANPRLKDVGVNPRSGEVRPCA